MRLTVVNHRSEVPIGSHLRIAFITASRFRKIFLERKIPITWRYPRRGNSSFNCLLMSSTSVSESDEYCLALCVKPNCSILLPMVHTLTPTICKMSCKLNLRSNKNSSWSFLSHKLDALSSLCVAVQGLNYNCFHCYLDLAMTTEYYKPSERNQKLVWK